MTGTTEDKPLTIFDVYPDLKTTEGMINLLNKYPNLLEDGIPMTLMVDLACQRKTMTDVMLMVIDAITTLQRSITLEPEALSTVTIAQLKDLGYTLETTVDNKCIISGWYA